MLALGSLELLILMVIVALAGIVVFVGVLRVLFSPRWSRGAGARELLQQRYARGEISREEYQERLQDLA